MHPTLTVRARIIRAFLAFGMLLSSGFAVVALTSMADFERILVGELLQVETGHLVALRRAQPSAPLPASRRMYAYVSTFGDVRAIPAALALLPPGTHVLGSDGHRETYVAVLDDGAQRFYFVIDLSDIAQRERFLRWLLVAVIVLGTLVSGALGMLLAGRVIAPVQRLARWVDASAPPQQHQPLQAQFANDELGALAQAFDQHQVRLDAFLRREREFTADTSHELRSPLSVVHAGLDVLAEEQAISAPGRRALQRMHRRADELTDLLDALLYLARGENETSDTGSALPLLATWQGVIAEQATLEASSDAQVSLTGDAAVAVFAPRQAASLVFGHLLRLGCAQLEGTALSIIVKADRVELHPWLDVPDFPAATDGQARSDRRYGMTLIGRLCTRLGWEICVPTETGEPLTVRFTAVKRNEP